MNFFVLSLITVAVLLVVGFVAGGIAERSHIAHLDEREARSTGFLLTDLKTLPPSMEDTVGQLVMGEAVIASDYLKSFFAQYRNIFGGEMRSFDTLLKRARRESRLRMIEAAQKLGAAAVINVRIETSQVGGQGLPSAEAFTYGTALIPRSRGQ